MSEKLKLDLPVLLPDVPDERDHCVSRLIAKLEARPGVETIHVDKNEVENTLHLCIHYDPETLSLSKIRQLVEMAGANLTEQFGHLLLQVEGIPHPRRARTVEERLKQQPGILEAEAASEVLRIEYDRKLIDEAAIQNLLKTLGVRPVEAPPRKEAHDHDHGGVFGEKSELVFAILSGVLLLTGWLLETFTASAPWISFACYLGAFFFGGFYTVREAIDSVRVRRLEIDSLMIVAAVGAAVLGEWAEGALLLFLFSIGHALEGYAMGKARQAIEALAELAPKTAIVRRDGLEQEIPIEAVQIGDIAIVRPNERIPSDGFVIKGKSGVNQAPVTGESMPVDKEPVKDPELAMRAFDKLKSENRVFAGTINGSGALEIQVTKLAKDTTLARVMQMVNEAETQKSPTQRFTDKFERIFVPSVLGLVGLLLFAGFFINESFSTTFYRAMAVLVAASPCALAIATPSAVLSGVARAGRSGVLIKGGAPLENLGTLNAIAFDKTGTLTEGKPRVTDVIPYEGASEEELLITAVAVEKLSDHPLAEAVIRFGEDRLGETPVPQAHDVESITGFGIKAVVEGRNVMIGKEDLFKLPQALTVILTGLRENGCTAMIVQSEERFLGVIALMDVPRESARAVIQEIHQLGIKKMMMISGDHQRVAEAIAKNIGLDEAFGNLLPEDKVETIKRLSQSGKVAMVGDGVNDAPAMANATVGIAMGAAGSDVALETADVALMADDLTKLPFAIALSRKTSAIIRQNVWVSLGVVAFLIPATIMGLRIGPAVALHEGSTLIVAFNALRLLAFQYKQPNQV